MNVLYLHGFASSARSTKAIYLAERFAERRITLQCPDLNEADFATLTMTRMLAHVEGVIGSLGGGPVVLIGSSLGAVVAIHIADRMRDRIDRVILLAPAVMFPRDADKVLGAERVRQWRETGTLDVFHDADRVMRPLNFAFYEDSVRYDAMTVRIEQPTLVFQGLRDEAVDHLVVEEYARSQRNAVLTLLDDDHRLTASLPRIWSDMAQFLGLA